MSKLKTGAEITVLREGGKRLAQILHQLAAAVRPGVSGLELDRLARELIAAGGDQPSFLHYRPPRSPAAPPYPAALCVSINEVVVHGIPTEQALAAGDIVGLDLGLEHGGLFTDMAITVPVGEISPAARKLLRATKEALLAGIKQAQPGRRLGDIGAAIKRVAERAGYGLVSDLGGHGVGHQVHEPPDVPNDGRPGTGAVLEAGMVLAIEPMFNLGTAAVRFLPDGYTVKTADGSLSAHFEHTVAITTEGPEILTCG